VEASGRRRGKNTISMPFSQFGLHPDLLRGVKEMGFTRPTPIQQDTIPPALEGKDVLACAMTGSGKTAAFILPILHRLMGKKRGVTRALVITPTRELAAQIDEHTRELAVHTPLSSAAVFGGVGMGPQEHAFRKGVDVMIATPGRLLDHFRFSYARLEGLEVLVLDEADRMLDMGFLPDIRRVLKHLPARRQTLFFSATMPPPIVQLTREMLKNPFTVNLERAAAPAVGITQAVYPVAQNLKASLLIELVRRGEIGNVLVFTRTKHRANRLAETLAKHGVPCERIHGNRSQTQRTQALAGFKAGRFRVLVATDIAARGIDVEALSHVVNFDVPHVPDDYIHRVGRTARAEMTGDAFTFVAPEEATDLAQIERAIGKRLPRITLPGFDYSKAPADRFEVPLAERIAAIRARKAEERRRAKEKAERRAAHGGAPARRPAPAGHRPAATPFRGPTGVPSRGPAGMPSRGPATPRAAAPSAPRWGRRG
jgi:ATP-dependent RNA helicase RhlE